MERIFITTVFLLPCIVIAACSEYVDPKKIFFNFDDDASNDDEQNSSADHDSGDQEQKQGCTNTGKYNKCLSDRKFICEQYLTFLSNIEKLADQHANQQVLTFDLQLSSSELFAIKNVLRSKNCPDDTSFLMTNIQPHYSWKMKIVDNLADFINRNKILIGMISATSIFFLLFMYWLFISRSFFSASLMMVVLAFIASVVETSVRKYQEQLALNKAILNQGVPKSCRLEEQGQLYAFWIYLRQTFSVVEDDCVVYYKAEMIEPMLKFTIIETVTETFSRWILTPLPIVLEYIGNSIVTLFRILPTQLWIPFTIMIYVSILLYLLLANGYRIRTLLFTIEPAQETRAVTSGSNQGNFLSRVTRTANCLTTGAQGHFVRNQIQDLPETSIQSPNIDNSHEDEKAFIADVKTEPVDGVPLSGNVERKPMILSTALNEPVQLVQKKGMSLSFSGGDESNFGSLSDNNVISCTTHTKNDLINENISEIYRMAIPHQETNNRKEQDVTSRIAPGACQGEGDGV